MRKINKHPLILLAFMSCSLFSFGQDFLPVLNDNYMGINQALLQPSAIADSRFRSDFNVAGFSNDIWNDAMHFRSRWILYPGSIITNDNWWDENTYIDQPNGKNKSMFMSQSALGPGFMADMGSKFGAIGFTSRVRSITNVDGLDEPLFRLMYSNYTDTAYYNKWYYDEDMRAVQHVFGDYGLTYAREIFDKGNHFLKAGVTLKLLQGIAASYIQTYDLYYYFNGQAYPQAKQISLNSPYVKAGISDNWGDVRQDGSYSFSMNYQLTAKPSVGFDLGVVYEFRPRFYEAVNPADGTMRKDLNKYFIKVGFSLLDIGRLSYEKDYYSTDLVTSLTPGYQNRYDIADNSVPDNSDWLDANLIQLNYRNYVPFSLEMRDRINNNRGVEKHPSNKEKFYVKLPAAISFQVDVNLFLKGLYVNLTTYTGLNQAYKHAPNSHYASNYSITPRYENKWYSVSVPVSINQYKKLDVGLGIRAGVFYFGVNNLFSNVFVDPYGIHAYAGVKVPVPYGTHKKKTPKAAPVPTSVLVEKEKPTGNTITNNNFKIIKDSFNQITTNTVNSEKAPYPAQLMPITIQADTNGFILPGGGAVPGAKGPGQGGAGSQGINEGMNNNKSGSGNGNGNTGSGEGGRGGSGGGGPIILPNNSHIPRRVGFNQPPEPGTKIAPIYFAFGDSKTNAGNQAYLDSLAKILVDNPNVRVMIEGHTDDVGSEDFNMKLSRIRAEQTRDYLKEQGVSESQLNIAWYGESRPLDDRTKDTEEGRKLNRRVELRLELKNPDNQLKL